MARRDKDDFICKYKTWHINTACQCKKAKEAGISPVEYRKLKERKIKKIWN